VRAVGFAVAHRVWTLWEVAVWVLLEYHRTLIVSMTEMGRVR